MKKSVLHTFLYAPFNTRYVALNIRVCKLQYWQMYTINWDQHTNCSITGWPSCPSFTAARIIVQNNIDNIMILLRTRVLRVCNSPQLKDVLGDRASPTLIRPFTGRQNLRQYTFAKQNKTKQLVDSYTTLFYKTFISTLSAVFIVLLLQQMDAGKSWQRAHKGDVEPQKYIHICLLYGVILKALRLINTTMEIAFYFLYGLLICPSLPAGIVCLLQTSEQVTVVCRAMS